MRGNDTRLPKNCLSIIRFKLTVNNEWLFLGLYDPLYKYYAGTLTSMLITCIIIKSYALLWLCVYDAIAFTITSCMHIQWNFPVTDNLGADILSFIVRLSIFGS